MTSTVPTTVDEYDAGQRAKARAAGRPTERTSAPGIFGVQRAGGTVDPAYVWTDESGALAYFCPADMRTPGRVDVHALDKALVLPPRDANAPEALYPDLENPRRLIVADQPTLRRLLAWVKVAASTAAPDDFTAAAVHRRLTVASRLEASTRLVVLTRALQRKFWLGSQYDAADFGSWRRAFGFGRGATLVSVLQALTDLASEGRVHARWSAEAFNNESYGLIASGRPGPRAAISAFRKVEAANTAARAILTLDPLILDRGLLDGTVSTLRVLNDADQAFTAVLSVPSPVRPGRTVRLLRPGNTDPNEEIEVTLEAVSVARINGQDQLIGKFVKPRHARGAGRSRSERDEASRRRRLDVLLQDVTLAGNRTLLVTDAPFLPFQRSTHSAARWTTPGATRAAQDKAEGIARRDVPLDVIVAGAPSA